MLNLSARPGAPSAVLPPAPVSGRALTARELEVVNLLDRGLRDRDIAALLGISVRTVEKHVEHIFRKLRAHTRGDAVRLARPLRRIG